MAAGALVGVVVAQPVVAAVGRRCSPVQVAYGLCRSHTGTSLSIAIYVGLVLVGALLGVRLRLLFSPTLRRFVGVGAVDLPEINVRGACARIEWASNGGVSITDTGRSGFSVRSTESSGQAQFPSGHYRLHITASGPWTLRVARG